MSFKRPLQSIRVGVVVERRKSDSQWADYFWKPAAVLPDAPDLAVWSVLREEGGTTAYYAGSATVDLYNSETAHYRENLATGAAGLWVVISPSETSPPYQINAVTADPFEGEGYTESAAYIVEQVPMPSVIEAVVARFIDEHHVDREFVKRKRQDADLEALGRRAGDGKQRR